MIEKLAAAAAGAGADGQRFGRAGVDALTTSLNARVATGAVATGADHYSERACCYWR